ncbi:MAG: CTP synthase, partial [Bacteroidetes bacterium]|nr:CTP synthase [Bacteroidota bacterium]
DVLVCRTEHEITQDIKRKLALFCNVKENAVIQSIDANTIYDVPLLMQEQGLDTITLEKLKLPNDTEPDLNQWIEFLRKYKNAEQEVNIGLVGKYIELQDSYKSILEAFIHAGAMNDVVVNVVNIHSEFIEEDSKGRTLDGILVAPGFGERGIEGKIAAVKHARENNIPFFGICLGLQMAVIEYARHILKLEDANSTEMDDNTPHPVIDLMQDQVDVINKGGTMRLGAWDCQLKRDSLSHKIYGSHQISERHRHRYELNNKYLEQLENHGLVATGKNPETNLVEIMELPNHPWFIGVQFHPEYKSTVANPHPLFVSFIKAAKEHACNN